MPQRSGSDGTRSRCARRCAGLLPRSYTTPRPGARGGCSPVKKPELPRNPIHLAHRLRELGIPVGATRPTALSALAHRIPAPVLADLLGFSAKTLCKTSGELKIDYASYVARRA